MMSFVKLFILNYSFKDNLLNFIERILAQTVLPNIYMYLDWDQILVLLLFNNEAV